MAEMSEERLAEIRVRAEAATPGAWRDDRRADGVPAVHNGKVRICDTYRADGQSVLNAEFIAHAREDVPALLDEVERLTDENTRLRVELEAAKRDMKLGVLCEACVSKDCVAYKYPCYECVDGSLWDWRGVCAENGGSHE